MQLIEGRVNISPKVKKIAYAPQQAWILNQTVKQNILFGQEFEEEKYKKIVSLCELQPDMDIFPAGDETEIGEKGINLSGGQKQRISIARACYSNADLFLFDDPLSAVDAHVAKKLIHNIFSPKTGLLAGKTVILVTNNLSVLPDADQVVEIRAGHVILVAEADKFDKIASEVEGQTISHVMKPDSEEDSCLKSGSLVKEEVRIKGSVKVAVYLTYFRYMPLFLVVVIAMILAQGLQAGINYRLALWSRSGPSNYLMDFLILLMLLSSSFHAIGVFGLARDSVLASRHLHERLMTSLMHSPMSFLETTPIGRVLNRFSSDLEAMDSRMQGALMLLLINVSKMLTTFFVIVLIIPHFTLAIFPIVLVVYVVHNYVMSGERQVRRLESTTRSAILSHFTESLSGLSSIRAF